MTGGDRILELTLTAVIGVGVGFAIFACWQLGEVLADLIRMRRCRKIEALHLELSEVLDELVAERRRNRQR